MDDVLNKDRTAFVRQLEASNPESRLEAQYAPTIDFTKHVKNLSVRYVSTILPTENNLDDWIVLPLFQHGQDIPIDNDGRTAILVAHAPSLERLLEMWRERIDGERHDRREKKRHRKSERRECRHQKRAEKRKRKETEESDTKPKLSKHEDDEKEPHLSGIEVENIIVPAADSPAKNSTSTVVSVRDNESDCKGCEGLPNTNVKTIEHVLHREAKVDNKLTRDCMGQIKTCSQSASKQHINLAERQVDSKQEYSSLTEVTVNASAGKSIQNCGRALKQRDPTVTRDASTIEDSEGIMAMENQIATIEAAELAQDVKVVESAVCEIHLESDHAALNLERELNGEAVECKKFTESLIRVEPSFVVVDPLPEPIPEQRPSKLELKKNSASTRVKNSLLQRMAEGREVDVDATNAAASENDYKNTFCYLCRIDFPSSKGLYLHNVKLHSEGEVQCDVCYKPLKNRITLMKHKKLHLGAEDMQCMCTDCGRPFKDKRALTAHVTYTRHMLGVPVPARS